MSRDGAAPGDTPKPAPSGNTGGSGAKASPPQAKAKQSSSSVKAPLLVKILMALLTDQNKKEPEEEQKKNSSLIATAAKLVVTAMALHNQAKNGKFDAEISQLDGNMKEAFDTKEFKAFEKEHPAMAKLTRKVADKFAKFAKSYLKDEDQTDDQSKQDTPTDDKPAKDGDTADAQSTGAESGAASGRSAGGDAPSPSPNANMGDTSPEAQTSKTDRSNEISADRAEHGGGNPAATADTPTPSPSASSIPTSIPTP